MTLTAVSASTSIARRRIPADRKSRTNHSRSALGWALNLRCSSHMPNGISSRPSTTRTGTATKTTSPAYGLSNSPHSSAISRTKKTTAAAVVRSTPTRATGCRTRTVRLGMPSGLLEALHVGDEAVELSRRQRRPLLRHRRLLGGTRLGGHRHRIGDPRADVSGRKLRPDTVERVRLVALAGDGVADGTFLRVVDAFTLFRVLRRRLERHHEEQRGC